MSAPPAIALTTTETSLLEPIHDVAKAMVQRSIPAIVAAGLGPSTFWHLHFLDRGKERHPSEIARRMGVTPAASTSSVDLLVDLGYVVRRPSERDRRQVVLVVTPKGHRTVEEIWRGFDTSLRGVLRGVSSRDVETTARTLRTVAARLRAEAPGRVEPEARP